MTKKNTQGKQHPGQAQQKPPPDNGKPNLKLHEGAPAKPSKPLTSRCPAGKIRCKRVLIDGEGKPFCRPFDDAERKEHPVGIKSYQVCPWPSLRKEANTILVCRKHGEGVEAFMLSGSKVAGQWCAQCIIELLGGLIPPLTVKEVEDDESPVD